MATLILSVIGSDRPGLTQALAGAVLSAGGNWLESHLSRLGGLYVGSVLVELESDSVDTLRLAVRAVDAQGLEVRIVPAVEGTGAAGDAVRFTLVGQDQPGIVHQVTAILSSLDVNIEAFDTRISAEPHSGAPLFHMEASLRLPAALQAEGVQAALEEISAEHGRHLAHPDGGALRAGLRQLRKMAAAREADADLARSAGSNR